MKPWLRVLVIVALIPLYVLTFVVVHEMGHTVLARLLGDPESVFYLWQVHEGGGLCLGCNVYDVAKLTPLENLIVALAGLGATQGVVLMLLAAPRLLQPARRGSGLLRAAVWVFGVDVPVQVLQGLLYNVEQSTWPTNVDLLDAMLLIQPGTGASQGLMKVLLAVGSAAYLWFAWSRYRPARGRAA